MNKDIRKENIKLKGFSLVEILIGIFVFLIIGFSVYEAYSLIFDVVRTSRLKITATALTNEQAEIIRNLPYSDVGIIAGIPNGKIPANQTLNRNDTEFQVKTTIRSIDDPFDGTLGGNPNDLSPADYRLVEIQISCVSCKNFKPLSFTTRVSPKNLETASTNGALFIQVFDANGQSLPGADVHIENNQIFPAIVLDDTTNNNGVLQIVDASPGVEAYEITVSKSGYSTDRTYLVGDPANPNPLKPHATVVIQQVTQISFSIDKLSTFNISSVTKLCVPVPNIDFRLQGSRLIGTNPDVFKYEQNHQTDNNGLLTIQNLEWDNYNLSFNDDSYDLAGSVPLVPINLAPNSTQNLQLIVTLKNPLSTLVTVKDSSTQLPLSDASVRLEKVGYDNTLITGRGFMRQTDWSGGGNQDDFINPTMYFNSDGNIETDNPAGEIRLKDILGEYAESGYLISSTFDTAAASNFYQLSWQPQSQPPEAGGNSVRFQIATNNDKTTWNFVGPGANADDFYTLSDSNITSEHNGNRYLRYKAYLETANTDFTPNISDVSFTFSSSCFPPGQVIFDGLASDTYTLTVSKNGYLTFTDTIDILSSWQQQEVILSP